MRPKGQIKPTSCISVLALSVQYQRVMVNISVRCSLGAVDWRERAKTAL
jgi:hypothetical protein